MSYDLVVWEGEDPADSDSALSAYTRALNQLEAGEFGRLSPQLQNFLDELLSRWPDLDAPGGEDSPWADCPLGDNGAGTVLVIPMTFTPMLDQAVSFTRQLANRHGLVVFDPQTEDDAVEDEPSLKPDEPLPALIQGVKEGSAGPRKREWNVLLAYESLASGQDDPISVYHRYEWRAYKRSPALAKALNELHLQPGDWTRRAGAAGNDRGVATFRAFEFRDHEHEQEQFAMEWFETRGLKVVRFHETLDDYPPLDDDL